MLPVGAVVAAPVTVNVTETGVLSTIELLAGETLTVGVVLVTVPPPLPPFPPLLPLLLGEDEPQPTAAKPMLATSMHTPSMFLHFGMETGTMNIRRANTTEPPAALNHLELSGVGRRFPVIAAVVITVTLAVADVTVELREIEEPVAEQVGRLVAPAGAEVSAQLKVTAPV
jgi:hypothetical protein